MAHITRLLTAAAILLALPGCVFFIPDKIHYTWAPPDAAGAPPADDRANGTGPAFVGLAFSGGGSRAAVFAAAGAEALYREGLLNRVTHISSVSGGSMAASYIAATPPDNCAPQDKGCAERYFAAFQTAMRKNYFWPMEWRQIINPNRFLDPNRRANSLREGFDKSFLRKQTFGDLPPDRVLLINAASYDDGRRFVFSNTALSDFREDVEPFAHAALQARSFEIGDCTSATPGDFPLSLAVAASAAFPPAIGPVTIEAPAGCGGSKTEYWHLGDGGILENTGVETLQEVYLRDRQNGRAPDRAVIFSFDAGKKDPVEASLAERDLRIWTRNPGRVVAITNIRGDAYWNLAWERLREELGLEVETVTITYTEHVPQEWPATCDRGERRSESIRTHLEQVPTRFSITACDADLMAASARLGVAKALAENGRIKSLLAD